MTWTIEQKRVVAAGFLGWMLDAFDFFLLVFVLTDIAKEFSVGVSAVSYSLMLTLAARPIGAFVFGRLADKYGRKPILMWNIGFYALFSFLGGLSPNLTVLLIIRTLFGIAMGGEWGLGSALVMESIPAKSRGFVSGLLQTGYPAGYFLASIVFGLLHDSIGWRWMLMLGILPAFIVFYIRRYVSESPVWQQRQHKAQPVSMGKIIKENWKLVAYAIVLMTAFNFFSHGTQDLYPTFLRQEKGFDTQTISWIAIIYNIGAILGGLSIGALSERIGRRNAVFIAIALALCVLPLWVFSSTLIGLTVGAFLMQVAVQGAWGIIPAYLNELAPTAIRATFAGVTYQLGNLIASGNAPLQEYIARASGHGLGYAMAWVIGIVSVVIAGVLFFGQERRGTGMM